MKLKTCIYCINWMFYGKNFLKIWKINETEPIPNGELGFTIELKISAKIAKNCSFHFSVIQYISYTIYISSGISELTRVQSLYLYDGTSSLGLQLAYKRIFNPTMLDPHCQCNIDLARWKSIDF